LKSSSSSRIQNGVTRPDTSQFWCDLLGLKNQEVKTAGGIHATKVGGTNLWGSSFWDYICLRTHRESMALKCLWRVQFVLSFIPGEGYYDYSS